MDDGWTLDIREDHRKVSVSTRPAPIGLLIPLLAAVSMSAASMVTVSCGPAATPPPPHPRVGAATAMPSATVSAAPIASATATASATPPPKTKAKLNVIVITIDAMRADMPWAGYSRAIAPNLTKLEKQSVSYTRAYSISSYTAMSMGGFLAGRYPGELPRSGYFFSSYPPDKTLFFPELLQQAGIRTMAGHAHFYFSKKKAKGLDQGFDDYRIVPGISADNTTDRNVTSPQHLAMAIDMLKQEKNTNKQFFAWFHFMDPHDLYLKHKGYQKFGAAKTGRGTKRDRYDGELFFTDHHVGKLLEFIDRQPWGKRTALIISSDHGEAFGEHKMGRHGFQLWEMLVHVPMFMRIPGVKAKRIDAPRSHIDLAPTIFELMGVKAHAEWQGKSLLSEMRSTAKAGQRDVIIDLPRTSDNFRRRAMVSGRYKIIAYGDDFRFDVFDVVDDPGELVNLKHKKRDVYKRMKKRYLEKVKTIKDVCPKFRNKLKGRRPNKPC